MKQRPRIYYTESQKTLMWERWRKGESLQQIAQLFNRNHSSIQRILAETGGIQPEPRRRSRLALTFAEREEISRGLMAGYSIRSIVMSLKRSPSTISREVNRNGGSPAYRASQAEQAAWGRAVRPKTCKLADNQALAHLVAEKLQLQWSPEHSGMLSFNAAFRRFFAAMDCYIFLAFLLSQKPFVISNSSVLRSSTISSSVTLFSLGFEKEGDAFISDWSCSNVTPDFR